MIKWALNLNIDNFVGFSAFLKVFEILKKLAVLAKTIRVPLPILNKIDYSLKISNLCKYALNGFKFLERQAFLLFSIFTKFLKFWKNRQFWLK